MKKLLVGLLICCVVPSAWAITYTGPGDMVGAALMTSTTTIMNALQSIAIKLLFSFLLLQAVIDGYTQIAKSDIESSMAWIAKFASFEFRVGNASIQAADAT